MAAPLGSLSDPGAEISLLEINQELQSQLEKSKQDFRDLKEKFLISEATAYSLANQLQKYSKSYKIMATKDMSVCIPSEKLKTSPDAVFSLPMSHKFHSDHNPGNVEVGILSSVC